MIKVSMLYDFIYVLLVFIVIALVFRIINKLVRQVWMSYLLKGFTVLICAVTILQMLAHWRGAS